MYNTLAVGTFLKKFNIILSAETLSTNNTLQNSNKHTTNVHRNILIYNCIL